MSVAAAARLLGRDRTRVYALLRSGDLVAASPEVSRSVERHANKPKPVGLSKAALEVLAIVAYRQPIAGQASN